MNFPILKFPVFLGDISGPFFRHECHPVSKTLCPFIHLFAVFLLIVPFPFLIRSDVLFPTIFLSLLWIAGSQTPSRWDSITWCPFFSSLSVLFTQFLLAISAACVWSALVQNESVVGAGSRIKAFCLLWDQRIRSCIANGLTLPRFWSLKSRIHSLTLFQKLEKFNK